MLWANFSRIPGAIKALVPESDEPHETSVPPALKGGSAESIRILFVDDSQSVRLAYRQLL